MITREDDLYIYTDPTNPNIVGIGKTITQAELDYQSWLAYGWNHKRRQRVIAALKRVEGSSDADRIELNYITAIIEKGNLIVIMEKS